MRIITKRGYDFGEVSSAMQKAIRRSDTRLAGYWALELWASGFGNYVWKRLLTVSAEDVWGLITSEIKALHDSYALVNKGKPVREHKGRIFISKAVILLCAARKNRDADRSSFSRNSKVLFAWTRGQINIAPASPDDNSVLVVSCGKNSNGREFKPFGIQLDPDTMIYERVQGFDFDQWREELEGKAKKKSEARCSVERVVDLLKPKQPLTKPELAKLMRDDTGLARSGCYEWIGKAERAGAIKVGEDGLLLRVS